MELNSDRTLWLYNDGCFGDDILLTTSNAVIMK